VGVRVSREGVHPAVNVISLHTESAAVQHLGTIDAALVTVLADSVPSTCVRGAGVGVGREGMGGYWRGVVVVGEVLRPMRLVAERPARLVGGGGCVVSGRDSQVVSAGCGGGTVLC
jgi:hypothetical protein